jgi:hypothetical protein
MQVEAGMLLKPFHLSHELQFASWLSVFMAAVAQKAPGQSTTLSRLVRSLRSAPARELSMSARSQGAAWVESHDWCYSA